MQASYLLQAMPGYSRAPGAPSSYGAACHAQYLHPALILLFSTMRMLRFPATDSDHLRPASVLPLNWLKLLFVLLAVTAAGCAPQLIAHRNQQVLDDTKALQKQTDLFLIKLQRVCSQPEGTYATNTGKHDELKAAASSLQVAVDAIPKNQITSAQVAELRKSYTALDSLHRLGCNPAALESARRLFNIHFTALITLEEAKN